MNKILIGLFLLAGIVGCSDEPAKEQVKLSITANNITPWPFTFNEATIRCEYQPKSVIEADGKLYALNGANSSKTPANGFIQLKPDSPEWLANPDIPGTKISLSNTIKVVSDTCETAKK